MGLWFQVLELKLGPTRVTIGLSDLGAHGRTARSSNLQAHTKTLNVGALTIRIGFWGFLIMINYSIIYPQNPVLIIKAPIL